MPDAALPPGFDSTPGAESLPAVGDFLKTILRSGLLDRAQLMMAMNGLSPEQRADPFLLAEQFIKSGKLSRFQANKLLKGASAGLVLGPFQVLAPIGKGGMSTVYLVRDKRTQKLLALKILPAKRAREEERMLARFQREMELSRRVDHPNIARTHEVGVEKGAHYIAMEFIPGKSLFRLVVTDGPLPLPRAARLFAEAAAALEHAHARGLIHRDLKPSNIMVTPNDHAKILDLGLALMQGETGVDRAIIGGQGYVVGSMDYIAPEQTENAAGVDARSDIYGLGCTLYFALTGKPPFPGGTAREKIHRHRHEEPAPLGQLNPQLPADFVALVGRMMAKDPGKRLATAAEAQRELLAWSDVAAPALPVDQAEDTGFHQAVEALSRAETPAELSSGDIPLIEVRKPQPQKVELVWWIMGGAIALVVLCGLVLGLVRWLLR